MVGVGIERGHAPGHDVAAQPGTHQQGAWNLQWPRDESTEHARRHAPRQGLALEVEQRAPFQPGLKAGQRAAFQPGTHLGLQPPEASAQGTWSRTMRPALNPSAPLVAVPAPHTGQAASSPTSRNLPFALYVTVAISRATNMHNMTDSSGNSTARLQSLWGQGSCLPWALSPELRSDRMMEPAIREAVQQQRVADRGSCRSRSSASWRR